MQFNTSNLSQPQLYTKKFANLRGLDYTNAKLDIADNRSPDAENLIFKDGINQKRNGYNQILKINSGGNFNGFWEFLDSKKKVHRIAHVGTKFYKVNLTDNAYLNTYKEISVNYMPSHFTDEIDINSWNDYLENGIKNRRSYGVVRGDRLYIFCGIMLVYGSWNGGTTWELRAVRDNEDTYVPVTTTNITHNNYLGESTRASLEEVNMMSSYRINRMFGDKKTSFDEVHASEISYTNSLIESKGGAKDVSNIFWSEGSQKCIVISQELHNIEELLFELNDGNNTAYLAINLRQTSVEQFLGTDIETNKKLDTLTSDVYLDTMAKTMIESLYVKYTYVNNYLELLVIIGNNTPEKPAVDISFEGLYGKLVYQLDSTNISRRLLPELTIEKNGAKTSYTSWGEDGYAVGNSNIKLDFETGQLTFFQDTKDESNPNPNIEIKFTTEDYINKHNYKKIDGCKIGIMFGYNGIEHLFVSGNDNYPNMDWHTTEALLSSESTAIPNSQNLTYFGDLSYAYLGNAQTKIMSYTMLNDNTLGILKEFSHNEPNLYVREPYLSDALDPSGNVVYDFSGNPYKKLYYKQYMAAIGEGCVSSYATSNLSGDKIFLSENGVYGIQLDYNNISSNQRYAKEKSRLINPKLEKFGAKTLRNSVGISFQNRYYLSINDEKGTVYIADARFRNSDASEMNDTMGYEWWCWTNVPAYIWFVDMDGNLGFGTKDGRLCSFNDENLFKDVKITPIGQGGISYDSQNKKFTINGSYDIKEKSKIHFETDLQELILEYKDVSLVQNLEELIICNEEDLFNNYIAYLDGKEVILKREEDIKCVITDVDYDINAFRLKYLNSNGFIVLAPGDVITRKLDNEFTTEYANNEFTLEALNGNNTINIYGSVLNIDEDLKAFILDEENVVAYWYTPYINFENSDFSKTLKYVTIIPEKVEHGSAKLELYTRTKTKEVSAFSVEGVDSDTLLDNLNFSSFSLEIKDFAQSFSKKLKIKNFNFLLACLKSDDDKNFAVQELTLTYVLGRRNKGVK